MTYCDLGSKIIFFVFEDSFKNYSLRFLIVDDGNYESQPVITNCYY